MSEWINYKDNCKEFLELCDAQGIEFVSTVHHFEQDLIGVWVPVRWDQIKKDPEGRVVR